MLFEAPIQRARLIRRYKRFLSDMLLPDGSIVTAHCPNPGTMLGLCQSHSEAWLLPPINPNAKLAWRWEIATSQDNSLVGINTLRANKLAEEALRAGIISELKNISHISKEPRISPQSRLDFVLTQEDASACFVEVKSVTLKRKNYAEFPDAKTARGLKHLDILRRLRQQGSRSLLLFIVQRQDCSHMRTASDIDPAYASALRLAASEGVEIYAYGCKIDTSQISVTYPIKIIY